jgi:hypothetical protein
LSPKGEFFSFRIQKKNGTPRIPDLKSKIHEILGLNIDMSTFCFFCVKTKEKQQNKKALQLLERLSILPVVPPGLEPGTT